MKHTIIKQSLLPSLAKCLPNAVSTWMAARAQFQNPISVYARKLFAVHYHVLFRICVPDRYVMLLTVTYITNICLNLIPYWTVKLGTMLLEFLFSWYKQYLIK